MIAVDDGLVNGNLNLADVFFLVGAILLALAAILYLMAHRPVPANGTARPAIWWHGFLVPAGLCLYGFGWFVL